MIIARAPLSITFIGNTRFTDKVISSTIDKYSYVVINHTPLINKLSAKYSISESVSNLNEIKNNRIREFLKTFNIKSNMEIGLFASLPSKVGLGSPQSFSTALAKGLSAHQNHNLSKEQLFKIVNETEIKISGPIHCQQSIYSPIIGGFLHTSSLNKDITHESVYLDFKKQFIFEDHLLMLYLGDQKDLETKKPHKQLTKTNSINSEISNLVDDFRDALLLGDIDQLAEILTLTWQLETKLGNSTNSPVIDSYYQTAQAKGAWGGKFLGDYQGGCLLLIVPPDKRSIVRQNLAKIALKNGHKNFSEINLRTVQSGVEILLFHYGI